MRDSSILIRDREVLEISKGKPYRGNRVPSADARDVPAKQKGLPIDPRSDENHRKWVQYPTVIQDPISKKIRLYYSQASCLRNLHLMGGETFYSESTDGINFTKPKKLFSKQCASMNFSPFLDPQDKKFPYKAVGGMHIREDHHSMMEPPCPNHKEGKYIHGEHRVGDGMRYCGQGTNHTCYGAGIYLFKSKDGIHWKDALPHPKKLPHEKDLSGSSSFINNNPFCPRPIITGIHEGQTDRLRGVSEFDGGFSVIFNKNIKKYVLYARLNVMASVRFVQYATSSDLVNWSPFKRLNLIGFDFEVTERTIRGVWGPSFYSPHFFTFEDQLLGYGAFYIDSGCNTPNCENWQYNLNHAGIYLVKSSLEKFHRWEKVAYMQYNDFYNPNPHWDGTSGRFKTENQTVNGLTKIGNKYYLYIQENYYNFHVDEPSYITRYEVKDIMSLTNN